MQPVVVAKNLHKAYAGFAPVLRGVDIEVQAGELVAIMGPSGCGKSTMLHILGMLHQPDSGKLEILDTDVFSLNREQTAAFRRGNMGFVMQSSNLFEHSTVFENVEFPLIYERIAPQERWERVIRALELVRLSARVHYRSNRLSGGEQQRVAIARAMVNNPRILLADEPTGALDAHTSRLIMENFRTLCHTGGVAMVMVTHDPKMADYCDSIYTLEDGILVCQRHTAPEMAATGGQNLLAPPVPDVRGGMVAEVFPETTSVRLVEDARRLYDAGLLFRIYALDSGGVLGNVEGYALPLAIRRMGLCRLLARYGALSAYLRTKHISFSDMWNLAGANSSGGLLRRLGNVFGGILLAQWAEEENIDFLFAKSARDATAVAAIASFLTHLPLGIGIRSADAPTLAKNLPPLANKFAFLSCENEVLRNRVREIFPEMPEDRLLLVRPAVSMAPSEEELEMAVSTREKLQDQTRQLLFVGTLNMVSGLDTLLRALALLPDVDWHLKIVGQGPRRLALSLLVWRLGLRGKVSFMGRIPHENMAELYDKADILLVPSCEQGKDALTPVPQAVVEAMAFALPIIATRTGALPEVVQDGINGLLATPDDAQTLAQVIKLLCEDGDRRLTMGRNAREHVYATHDSQKDFVHCRELVRRTVAKSDRKHQG